jgi:hypothetical protein
MMISEEEREGIIAEAIERLLIVLPEVVGNLMQANVTYSKLSKKFYLENPDLVDHKDIVREMVNKVEGENPLLPHDQVLSKALPTIRDHIKLKGGLCMGQASKPQTPVMFNDGDNGVI